MRIKYYFLPTMIACVAIAVACSKNKTTSSQNNNNYVIAGIAYIKPFYNNNTDSMPLRNKLVFIAIDSGDNTDTGNYFFSMPTKNDGSFAFYVPDVTHNYRIFTVSYDTISPTFIPLYYDSFMVSPPYNINTTYKLIAFIDTMNRNGIIINTIDKNRNIVPNVNVILYTSAIIANQDSTYSGMGSFRQIQTDSLGKAFIGGLTISQIFESAKVKFGNSDSIVLFDSALMVPKTGILRDTVILR
jgi:hypothetical protein